MRETKTHIYFWGTFLSNWIPSDLEIPCDGHIFTNSEQLFMYYKANFFGDKDMAKRIVEEGQIPKVAKELGGKVRNFKESDWSKVREQMMYNAIFRKFTSNRELMEKLLATGNKTLVEGTPMDPIWGVMVHWKDDRILDERNWRGKNLLGKVLMRVRQDLKSQIVNG